MKCFCRSTTGDDNPGVVTLGGVSKKTRDNDDAFFDGIKVTARIPPPEIQRAVIDDVYSNSRNSKNVTLKKRKEKKPVINDDTKAHSEIPDEVDVRTLADIGEVPVAFRKPGDMQHFRLGMADMTKEPESQEHRRRIGSRMLKVINKEKACQIKERARIAAQKEIEERNDQSSEVLKQLESEEAEFLRQSLEDYYHRNNLEAPGALEGASIQKLREEWHAVHG